MVRRGAFGGRPTGDSRLTSLAARPDSEIQRVETNLQRFTLTSAKPFATVVAALEAAVGHPDMRAFSENVAAAKPFADLVRFIDHSLGESGLMEFARFDIGAVLRKESGAATPHILRLLLGNPLIMKQMAAHVPDAGSYAPVTILIDERADGVHLSYDRMAGFLAPYGSAAALEVARKLDAKIEELLTAAA